MRLLRRQHFAGLLLRNPFEFASFQTIFGPGDLGKDGAGPGSEEGRGRAGGPRRENTAAGRRTSGAGPWRRSRNDPFAAFRAKRRLRSAHDFSAARSLPCPVE